MNRSPFSLPLMAPSPEERREDWHGYTVAGPLSGAAAAPEPDAPQGEYGQPGSLAGPALSVPISGAASTRPVELLAPAGGPDAAWAAFQYGADAIYLGLKKFSARAEAENFTLDELNEVVAWAHSLTPRRRVFVTVNTLIRNDELPELVETLGALSDLGVDALILQDLGVHALVRRYFPWMELHASTQLAVHNRAGAEALRRLGFARVVLARELTFEEVHDITASSGIETEVFIHGALCYSYSGLCLFSSQTLGRSGNRGRCAYSCRDSFEVEGAPTTLRDGRPVQRDPAQGFPFSMKDLALPDHLPALRAAGVSCFKIEGRKKSPLYVATTTDYYRQLLDGTLDPADRASREADLQAVFSRPWTHLFVESHQDKEVADRDTVGHRGTVIGAVERVVGDRSSPRLRFRSARPLERHDGLQVDLPILGKPFGFAVDRLWIIQGRRTEPAYEAAAGDLVEVELPSDHPELPIGAVVYCSSSQAVKRQYKQERPRPGQHRVRQGLEIRLSLTSTSLIAAGRLQERPGLPVGEVSCSLPGPFSPARDRQATEGAARGAFEKLGETALFLADFSYHDPEGVFIPVSRLNQMRREIVARLEEAVLQATRERTTAILHEVCPPIPPPPRTKTFAWSIEVDRIHFLDAFTSEDWAGLDEVIVEISRDHPALLVDRLEELAEQVGRERIRLALPALTRKWEEHGLIHKLERLRERGWRKWQAANLSAWTWLGLDPASGNPSDLDLTTDWSVYALNRVAARQLLDRGVSRVTLSPEDGLANIQPMLAELGEKATLIVYQDTPLFLAESCAYANLIGGCPGKANCTFESMEMQSSHGERVTALDYHCRTIVLNQGPFCLSPRLHDLARAGARSLRADFLYRKYDPAVVVERWRAVRAGRVVPGGHAANFDRGVL